MLKRKQIISMSSLPYESQAQRQNPPPSPVFIPQTTQEAQFRNAEQEPLSSQTTLTAAESERPECLNPKENLEGAIEMACLQRHNVYQQGEL